MAWRTWSRSLGLGESTWRRCWLLLDRTPETGVCMARSFFGRDYIQWFIHKQARLGFRGAKFDPRRGGVTRFHKALERRLTHLRIQRVWIKRNESWLIGECSEHRSARFIRRGLQVVQ